jgi:hypothetical protein
MWERWLRPSCGASMGEAANGQSPAQLHQLMCDADRFENVRGRQGYRAGRTHDLRPDEVYHRGGEEISHNVVQPRWQRTLEL